MANQKKCIIWDTNASVEFDSRDNDRLIFDSPRAGGKYIVERQRTIGVSNSWNWKNQKKIRFSGYIAQKNLLDENPPLLDFFLDDEKKWLKDLPPIPDNSDEKSDLLLKGLAKLYPDEGKIISLNKNIISDLKANPLPFLYALSYCSNEEDFQYLLLDVLKQELEYIKIESNFTGGTIDIKITPKGWKRIKEIESTTPNEKSKTVFIAMWFHNSMNALNEEIKKGIKQAGYEPLRIDEKEYNNKIDDEILSDIDHSRFVVCDLTSEPGKPRGSVYFEAGYATKDKSNNCIIWTCDKRLKDEIAFDVGRYNFIFWYKDKNGDFWTKEGNEKILLKDKIQKRIEGIIKP